MHIGHFMAPGGTDCNPPLALTGRQPQDWNQKYSGSICHCWLRDRFTGSSTLLTMAVAGFRAIVRHLGAEHDNPVVSWGQLRRLINPAGQAADAKVTSSMSQRIQPCM